MIIRALKDSDYDDLLSKWWSQWGWLPPMRESLPNNGTGGFIIEKDGVGICAGYLYETNSNMAWCEYIVSNKEYNDSDRKEAILLLIKAISTSAKEKGFKFVFTTLSNQPLISKYKQCGFIESDSGCTNMVKVWQE